MLRSQALYTSVPQSKNAKTLPSPLMIFSWLLLAVRERISPCLRKSCNTVLRFQLLTRFCCILGFISIPLWEWIVLRWIRTGFGALYFLVSRKVLREVREICGWPAGGGEGQQRCSKEGTISPLTVIRCSATTSAAGSQPTTWAGTSSSRWRSRLLRRKVRELYDYVAVGKTRSVSVHCPLTLEQNLNLCPVPKLK